MNPSRSMKEKLVEVSCECSSVCVLLLTYVSGTRASLFVYVPITVAKLNIIIFLLPSLLSYIYCID